MKNFIKNYAKNITQADIKNFAIKENITITKQEIDLIYNAIKNDTDSLLNGGFQNYLNNNKHLLSKQVYDKVLEYYGKYKKFID